MSPEFQFGSYYGRHGCQLVEVFPQTAIVSKVVSRHCIFADKYSCQAAQFFFDALDV